MNNVKAEDKIKFLNCINSLDKEKIYKGIGTYKEKTLHMVIKNYYESDKLKQEIKVGDYVADILNDEDIIEIQTRSFNKLVNKLNYFMQDHHVKVIYPIAYNKWVSWVDCDSGEITKERKSPKKGSIYDSIIELYKIKRQLNNNNLKVVLLFIDIKELRYLNGWSENKKRGASRCDQLPVELIDEIILDDFKIFIPFDETMEFTSKDLAKVAAINLRKSQVLLTILTYINVCYVVRKDGRLNVYKLTKNRDK